MSESQSNLPPEILRAYKEAKERGLPDGWVCSVDEQHRRTWTSPDGRTCNSVRKALEIAAESVPLTGVELGKRSSYFEDSQYSQKRAREDERPGTFLRASIPVITLSSGNAGGGSDKDCNAGDKEKGKQRRRPKPRRGRGRPRKTPSLLETSYTEETKGNTDENEWERDEEPLTSPPPPLDPEYSLDGKDHPTAPTTVHWDPQSADGKKIGWKIRVALDSTTWAEGRIVRYDPYTHKHKIRLQHNGEEHYVWIWIRNKQHNVNLATRIVWAHMKGYAWWPVIVMETNTYDPLTMHVQVEYFGSTRRAKIRDVDQYIRPFHPNECDPIEAGIDIIRNAYEIACVEFKTIQKTQNEAALFYAEKSLHLCDQKAPMRIVGRRVQVFRDDVNYPYGDTVVGTVRKYSGIQKKFLVSFEVSEKTNSKYDAMWMTLSTRNAKLQGKRTAHAEVTPKALVPFLVGYQADESDEYYKLLNGHCRACVETWKSTDSLRVVCDQCHSSFHLGCFDPPLQQEQYQKLVKDGAPLLCPQCTVCRGCYQKDSTFGSHQLSPIPNNLNFPAYETLNVCLPCREAYEEDRYCPNCAHTFDDDRYNEVRQQHNWYSSQDGCKQRTGLVEDTEFPLATGRFSDDCTIPQGLEVHPSRYYPENTEFGMAEAEMLGCDSCGGWVHAGCANLTREEYEQILNGNHKPSATGQEFLCRVCCRKRCLKIIKELKLQDRTMLFSQPISRVQAPIYHDLIEGPVNFKVFTDRAQNNDYFSYAWTRELFELMVFNALSSCGNDKATWNEAKHFYLSGLKNVFQKIGKGAPPGVYDKDIQILLKNGQKLQCRSEVHRARDVIRAKNDDRASAEIVPAAGVSPLNAAAVLNADSGSSDPIHASQTSTPYHRNMGGGNSKNGRSVSTATGPPAQPKAAYNQTAVGRMVLYRENADEIFWVRCRVEKREQLRVDEIGEDGNISTCETVIHVIKCCEDSKISYRVDLEQSEQLKKLIWI